MTTTADFGLPLIAAQQAQPEITHNEMVVMLQAILCGVINMTTATPPGSPTEGDAYVVATSPTGAWAGRTNCIAIYLQSQWRFIPGNNSAGAAITMGARQKGMRTFNQADETLYAWDGTAWVALAVLP